MRRAALVLALVLGIAPVAAVRAETDGGPVTGPADAGATVTSTTATRDGGPATGPLGRLVDDVVLVVGDKTITRSDLELEARVALVSGGGMKAAFGRIDADTVASVLDYVIDQMLIVAEAERLQVFQVSPDDVSRALDRFMHRFPDRASWEAFLTSQDVTPERIAAVFRRNLRVKRYIDSRVKLTVHVTDGEVAAYYRAHRGDFDGRPLAKVRDVVRSYLFKQHYETAVRRMVKDLRDRARVRVLFTPAAFPAVAHPRIAKHTAGVLSNAPP